MALTRTLRVLAVAVPLTVCPLVRSAQAIPAFQKQFWSKYLGSQADPEYVELVKKKVKCNLCHDPNKRTDDGKKSKKFRNSYGEELAKLLDRKQDKKNTEKIAKALDTVANISVDKDDPQSPTFGQLIAQGKLPAGEPPEEK